MNEDKANKGWECGLCDTYSLGDGAVDRLVSHVKRAHKQQYGDGAFCLIAIRWNHAIPEGIKIPND